AFGETKKNFSFFLTVFSNGTDDFADQPFDGHFNSLLLMDKKGFPKHFTFYAKRTCANGVTDPTKTTAGVITVGGKDEMNCDKELVSVPSVYSDLRYTLTLDAYKVGGKTHSDGWNGVLSSKATELIVPKKDFDKISTAFGATAQSDGSFTVDCTKTPGDLTLTFNGVDLKVPFAQLVRQVDNVCTLLIKPRGVGHSANDPSEWSLGLPFAREYCQIFAKGGKHQG
ncbi:gastricsin-like protein, partial [Aphelenchoides avenae]